MKLGERLTIPETYHRRIAGVLELCLVGFVFVGIYNGETGVAVNSAVALAVIQLPPLLERNAGIVMDPWLVLWLTLAVFLHALGTLGLPGGTSFYRSLGWWDHVTHLLSSSVVAATGYIVVRALDEHVPELRFTPAFVFVFILVSVVAFGVVWEVLEFAIGQVAAITGTRGVLTQYGLRDSMLDLVFDIAGGLVVAVWGTAYLGDLTGQLVEYFETRT